MILLAQRVSSADDAGWQTNRRRRLGDSALVAASAVSEPATPKPREGGVIVTFDTPGSPLVALYGSRRKYGSKRSSRNAEVFWTKYT